MDRYDIALKKRVPKRYIKRALKKLKQWGLKLNNFCSKLMQRSVQPRSGQHQTFRGLTGIQGVTGPQGYTGIQGVTGPGMQGMTGMQGMRGNSITRISSSNSNATRE